MSRQKESFEVTSTMSGWVFVEAEAVRAAMLPHMAESLEFQTMAFHTLSTTLGIEILWLTLTRIGIYV